MQKIVVITVLVLIGALAFGQEQGFKALDSIPSFLTGAWTEDGFVNPYGDEQQGWFMGDSIGVRDLNNGRVFKIEVWGMGALDENTLLCI